jgi:galactokinase
MHPRDLRSLPKHVAEFARDVGHKFRWHFGEVPSLYLAPGRVNLIGEHTDYNDGFVMPAAIGFHTVVAARARQDRKVSAISEGYTGTLEFDLDQLPVERTGQWGDYVVGVAHVLEQSGCVLRGTNLLISGDIPQGAGLSSSASLEISVGYALLDIAQHPIDLTALAVQARRAENDFVGANCGIMDQFICAHGKEEHALFLDCRALQFEHIPVGKVPLVICNTMVKHSISRGQYNSRRSECEQGLRHVTKRFPHVITLRDATAEDVEACRDEMPEVLFRRCRHVVTENARVEQATTALRHGDLHAFGALMNQSHQSLRDDFEVSCVELDAVVELGRQIEGVYGVRMTGGGFGGCTIALMGMDSLEEFQAHVTRGYERAMGITPEIYVCYAASGAQKLE